MISSEEKTKMLQAKSVGPKIVEYMEMLGFETLTELREENAVELAMRVDDMLGTSWANHSLAIRSLENLIEHALNES